MGTAAFVVKNIVIARQAVQGVVQQVQKETKLSYKKKVKSGNDNRKSAADHLQ